MALLGARAACFGTSAAVVMVSRVLLAFGGAAVTDLGTHPAGLRMKIATTHQQPGRKGAGIGAVPVQPNAPGHHLDFFLGKAGCSTVLTGREAIQAGVETGLQFRADIHLHRHVDLRVESSSIENNLSRSCKG